MKKVLFFLTSIDDAKKAKSISKKEKSTDLQNIFVSTDPLVNIFLEKNNILYRDSSDYFYFNSQVQKLNKKISNFVTKWYLNKSIKKYLTFENINLGEIISFSLHNYLSEIAYCDEIVTNMLNQETPNIIYLSRSWVELPFVRYQSEKFTLQNIILYKKAKDYGITVKIFGNIYKYLLLNELNFLFKALILSVRNTILEITNKSFKITAGKLVILANYYQLENFIPFILALKKKKVPFTVIGKTYYNLEKKLHQKKISYINIGNNILYYSSLIKTNLMLTLKYLLLMLMLKNNIKRTLARFSSVYWSLLSPKFSYYFSSEFPMLVKNLIWSETFFGKNTRALITIASTDNFSKIFSIFALKKHIRIFELQHGILLFDLESIHRLNNYYVLWSKKVKQIVNKGSVHKEKYLETGYPFFDKYKKLTNSYVKKKSIYKRIKIDSTKKTVLILSVFPSGISKIYSDKPIFSEIKYIFELISNLPEKYNIILRSHPSSNPKWIVKLATNYNFGFYYDSSRLDFKDIISVSDIVISNPTTAMIEAMYYKKPIFSFSYSSEKVYKYKNSFFASSGAVKIFENRTQLHRLFNELQSKEFRYKMFRGQKKFLEEYCMAFSDSSAGRTVETILNILQA